MKYFPVLITLIVLSGCASMIMDGYKGKTIQDVMLDYGPPANSFDMDDDRRVFQWMRQNSYTTPTNAYSSGTSYGSWVNTNTTIYGGQTFTDTCAYTLFAEWQNNHWVVVDYKKPSIMCE